MAELGPTITDRYGHWTVPDAAWENDVWLSGGYARDGTPNTISEQTARYTLQNLNPKEKIGKAWGSMRYAFNDHLQFWPTRDPTKSASSVGSTVPTAATNCTNQQVNAGTCRPPLHVDDTMKIRFRPRLDRLDANPNNEWWGSYEWDAIKNMGLCVGESIGVAVDSFLDGVSNLAGLSGIFGSFKNDSCKKISPKTAEPADVIGATVKHEIAPMRWEVRQNEPCLRGKGMVTCIPCEQNGAAVDQCAVIASRVNEVKGRAPRGSRPPLTQTQRQRIEDLHARFPCPLPEFTTQIGEGRIPYNIMTARGDKGEGVKDTYNRNYYTCEYATNAIQDVQDLRTWVDALLERDEVAPCCTNAIAAAGTTASANATAALTANTTAAKDLPRPCWYVRGDAPLPFLKGMPEDAAAVFVANFAERVRKLDSGALCGPDAQALLDQIDRAREGIADPTSFQTSLQALDLLADAIRSLDTEIRPCVVRTGLNSRGETVKMWSPWESVTTAKDEQGRAVPGNPGECSLFRQTSNPRLECGVGVQQSRLTVIQEAHCGGQPCPPLIRYRFCSKGCTGPEYPYPQREACVARCSATEALDYDRCFAMIRGDEQCRQLTSTEKDRCVQQCNFDHPAFECSSNLCLSPGRVDPITGNRGPPA